MPFKKIKPPELQSLQPCNSLEHKPPKNILLETGWYVYACPKCGEEESVHIEKVQF